jgi:hypothetical protein
VKQIEKKFEAQLPSFFQSVLKELRDLGYVPTLVGGSVRDYFLQGELGKDWDIELVHETLAFSKDQWKDLGKVLSKFGKVSYLSYEIIRLEIDHYQLEFSPPRSEIYDPALGNHHSNFVAEFDFKLPFEKAVLRRDFTINTLGVRFLSWKDFEFLDPLDGLKHLQEKILIPAGPDFSQDPVRYLRALRFSLSLGFDISPPLKNIMDQMNVSGLSASYLWSELQKSKNPISFFETLIHEKKKHPELKIPVNESFLPSISDIKKILVNTKSHESWVIALEWSGLSSEEWSTFFGLSSETCRRLGRWASTSKFFQVSRPENYQGEFDDIKNSPDFERLFDWYFSTKQLLQKNPDLPLLKMVEEYLPHWIHFFKFEAPKDVKHIDPPFRAKYQVWNLCQRL